jgi:hypothetical protein
MNNKVFHSLYTMPNIYQSGQIKEDEMGRACSTQMSDMECKENFSQRT